MKHGLKKFAPLKQATPATTGSRQSAVAKAISCEMHNQKATDQQFQDPPAPWICTHMATPSSAPAPLSALPKEAPSATVNTFYYHEERLTAKAVWVGIAESVLFIRTVLPACGTTYASIPGRQPETPIATCQNIR